MPLLKYVSYLIMHMNYVFLCARACSKLCVCVHACVRACMRARARVCVCVLCVCVCVCVCVEGASMGACECCLGYWQYVYG